MNLIHRVPEKCCVVKRVPTETDSVEFSNIAEWMVRFDNRIADK
ncbi:MAG: hypothetical protein QF682_00795 [Candidatus Thermoplasmatota archaeon]|nr:hypothetical protein [Candidatus Thermoplasmatota archaeon]